MKIKEKVIQQVLSSDQCGSGSRRDQDFHLRTGLYRESRRREMGVLRCDHKCFHSIFY